MRGAPNTGAEVGPLLPGQPVTNGLAAVRTAVFSAHPKVARHFAAIQPDIDFLPHRPVSAMAAAAKRAPEVSACTVHAANIDCPPRERP